MSLILKSTLIACLLLLPSTLLSQEQLTDEFYLQNIKPVLQERCFACHGALKQASGLRVDTVQSMRDHGILESDDLLQRLTSEDTEFRMPPEGEPLNAEQVQSIGQWIKAGAPAPRNEQAEADPMQHWAFQKIQRPRVPESNQRNPIDAFLHRAQQAKGLQPQPPAQRNLLLRRLYLDVTGLPPTPEQLLTDQSLSEVIEALLDSPQYGERWARHWMDIWRYSDWYGLNKQLRNSQKHLWHWREWIVNSLNQDRGYDQMVREMLAGDELAPNDLGTVAATGFLARNYYLFNRTTWLDDTIEHTGKAFLGLTLNCAKCHDHKYDPISQDDYYRFRAIFEPHHVRLDALPGETNFDLNGLPRVYDDDLDAATYLHRRGNPADPVKDKLVTPGVPKFLKHFETAPTPIQLPVEAWAPGVRDYVQADLLAQAKSKVESARRDFESAKRKVSDSTSLTLPEQVGKTWSDDFKRSRPNLWQTIGRGWRYQGGLLAQTQPTMERSCLRSKRNHPRDFELNLRFQTTGGNQWKSTGIRFDADTTGENANTVYVSAFEGGPKVQLSHTVAGRNIYPGDAKVDLPIRLNQEYVLNVRVREDLINVSLDGKFLFAYRLLSRNGGAMELFAFDSTADFYSIDVKRLADDIDLRSTKKAASAIPTTQLVDVASAQLKLAEAELEWMKARIDADSAAFRDLGTAKSRADHVRAAARQQLQVELAAAELEQLKAAANQLANARKRKERAKAALDSDQLPPHLPLRGSRRALDKASDKASQYPAIYAKTSSGRRTALAQWVTHRDNPLTARVAVNHIWTRHFGAPLVESMFDFGRRAPRPLHQDLLDYLAVELIESGWSMKHLHRLILSSEAWQRTSSNLRADSNTIQQDPQNRYYWRMNPRRMESQVLRDSLLHLSGRLDLTMGGPSVRPGPNVRRRSLYLFHSRDGRDAFVSTFDDADVFRCYRRNESIVPQQALAMMNSRESIEAAGHIVSRYKPGMPATEFVQSVFTLLLTRAPSNSELEACIAFLDQTTDRSQLVRVLLNHNDFQVIR